MASIWFYPICFFIGYLLASISGLPPTPTLLLARITLVFVGGYLIARCMIAAYRKARARLGRER